MRIFSLLFTFLAFEQTNAGHSLWHSWKPIFKKYIKQECGTQTDNGLVIGATCVNELVGIDALLAMVNNMSNGNNFEYQIEFVDVNGNNQDFSFAQTGDPFTEAEDDDTVTAVNWNGQDMTSITNFTNQFKKVKRKVFWWLKRKFPESFGAVDEDDEEDGERRRRRDDELDAFEEDYYMFVSRRRAEEIADEDELMGSVDELIQYVSETYVPGFDPAVLEFKAYTESDPKGKYTLTRT